MTSSTDILSIDLRRKIAGHAIKIQISCTVVGELIEVKSPFWLLPANARKLTYGKAAIEIDQTLKSLLLNYRFLLPLLAVPEPVLPGNLEPEDQAFSIQLREKQKNIPYSTIRKLRDKINDPWTKDLIYRAHHRAGIDFRRKLELIYDVAFLQKMNVYKLVDELKQQNDDLLVYPLILGLSRKNTTFRAFANRWLQDRLNPDMIPLLLSALNSSDEWVKITLLKLLEKSEANIAIPKVLELLHGDNADAIRRQAAYFLGIFPDEIAIKDLLYAVEDEDWVVRQNALESLGKIGSEKALPRLLIMLKDSKFPDKSNLISALGNHQFAGVAESLIPFLKVKELQFVTVSALGKLGDAIAINEIQRIYDNLNNSTRKRSVGKVLEGLK